MKKILATFFDVKGTVHFEFIPQGHTINQAYYVGILKWLREAAARRKPELWPSGFILHHDNVSAQKALSSSFCPIPLPKKSITETGNQHLFP
jgi:hypothetical protein